MPFAALLARNAPVQHDLVRNIKGIRQAQDLFDDLADDPADRALAVAVEGEGAIATPAALLTRAFDYGSAVSYSFDSAHWHATRYSDGRSHPAWYGSLDIKTGVFETVHHWHRFVLASFAGLDREVVGERRLLDVRCDALLADLRGRERAAPALVDRASYAFTQALAAYAVRHGVVGLLAPSARCEGVNAVLFSPAPLSRVREKGFLTYRCTPTRDRVVVQRGSGRAWLVLRPSTLG